MKIDRLLAIMNILADENIVTAPELAKRFEVSRRTINRDIEDLCMAGIPIVTKQGRHGGISLMEGFAIDRHLLKRVELSDILTGLKALDSVSKTNSIRTLINKIKPPSNDVITLNDYMTIDLSSYYKSSLSEKIDILRTAIENRKIVCFRYFSKSGESYKTIEPYLITFRWTGWYLLGFDVEKNSFRMYKLNRLWNLDATNKLFIPRTVNEQDMDFESHITDDKEFKAVFDESAEFLLVDSYGPGSYTKENGKLLFNGTYTNRDFIVGWLMGFGDKVTVTSPKNLIDEIKTNLSSSLANYQKSTNNVGSV